MCLLYKFEIATWSHVARIPWDIIFGKVKAPMIQLVLLCGLSRKLGAVIQKRDDALIDDSLFIASIHLYCVGL